MTTSPKKCEFWALCAAVIGAIAFSCHGILNRGSAPKFAKPDLKALASTALDGSSSFEGIPIALEGYWEGHFEGHSIKSATTSGAEGVLMRPHPRWLSPRPRSIADRILPQWLSPDPVILEPDDYVRISGTYHATGYASPGTILDSCGWLEFSKVERWDSEHRRWRSADHW